MSQPAEQTETLRTTRNATIDSQPDSFGVMDKLLADIGCFGPASWLGPGPPRERHRIAGEPGDFTSQAANAFVDYVTQIAHTSTL